MTRPSLGSLCTGYGGLDMAVRGHLGTELAWCADNDKHVSQILAARFPGVSNLGDLTTVDWATVPKVDVVAAGFPCQDISYAGRGAGIRKGTRSGLWYVIADALRLLRPGLVLLENVAALRARGLGQVLGDLATLGYDTNWVCVRASDVGAPHRRERIFIAAANPGSPGLLRAHPPEAAKRSPREPERQGMRPPAAHTDGMQRQRRRNRDLLAGSPEPATTEPNPAAQHRRAAAAHPQGLRHRNIWTPGRLGFRPAVVGGAVPGATFQREREGHPGPAGGVDWGPYGPAIRRWETILGRPAPHPTETGTRGQPRLNARFVEWMMGLPPGWVTDIPITRTAHMRVLGNGVVPQQALAALRELSDQLVVGEPAARRCVS
jgi:DNA (cytosine-5)-methyltransferase 1